MKFRTNFKPYYVIELRNGRYYDYRYEDLDVACHVAEKLNALAVWHFGRICPLFIPRVKRNNNELGATRMQHQNEYVTKWD